MKLSLTISSQLFFLPRTKLSVLDCNTVYMVLCSTVVICSTVYMVFEVICSECGGRKEIV